MRRAALALALAAAACASGAKQPEAAASGAGHGKPRTKHGRPYPETKAECGVVMFGTGDDYIQYSARNAQRIAGLAVGSGWCAAQPDLDHIPVVYFHDNVNADALVRKGLGGAAPRFELFYLGTRANPTMAKFEALPTQRRWARDYKWLRPQYYKRSPFRTTLNMDGDAVPCGARLVEAFRAFAESKAAVAGSAEIKFGASPPTAESRHPRHRRDAGSMAWRCGSYITRFGRDDTGCWPLARRRVVLGPQHGVHGVG